MKHPIHRSVLIILSTTVECDRSASSDTYHSLAMISCSVSNWWLRILPLFHSPWYSMTRKRLFRSLMSFSVSTDECMSWSWLCFIQLNLIFMTYLADYRRQIYIILTLIFLFIYIQLYTKSLNAKRKQILSPGSMKLSNICNSSLPSPLHLSHHHHHHFDMKLFWRWEKNSTVIVWSKEKYIRLILLDFIMNHGHDHAAMLANTTLSANLGDHVMDHGMHSAAAASGHSLHSKDMMMMAVSDFLGADRSDVSFEKYQKELSCWWMT